MEYGFVVREYLDFKQAMPHSQGLRSYGVKELSQMPRWSNHLFILSPFHLSPLKGASHFFTFSPFHFFTFSPLKVCITI